MSPVVVGRQAQDADYTTDNRVRFLRFEKSVVGAVVEDNKEADMQAGGDRG